MEATVGVRDNGLREKRDALRAHLEKVGARKYNYKIVKGIAPYKAETSVSEKVTLKSISKDFEKVAMSSISQSDDLGSQAVGMSYKTAKTALISSKKLVAINERIVDNSVKVVENGVQIGEKAYKVGATMVLAVRTGMVAGFLNVYKDMAFQKVGTAIKYSKPVYVVRNIGDGTKTIALGVSYNFSRAVVLAQGLKNGTIRITGKKVGAFVGKTAKGAAFGAGKLIYKSGKGLNNLSHAKIVRGTLKGVRNTVKNLGGNSDDMGIKTVGITMDSLSYPYKALKTTGKVGVDISKGVYKTARGTYRFAKDVSWYGVKGASRLWYDAHLRGAGRTLKEKIAHKLKIILKKLTSTPVVIGGIALIICAVVIANTAIVSATSVVGGVIEFFEELAEGLQIVWEKVTTAIADFFNSCASWLVSLFGGSNSPPAVSVDVDVGDGMSICDYLLGATQLYKAEFSLKIAERHDKLIKDEGYHGIIIYNLLGDSMDVHDINDPDKGLMSDKAYVKAILPVWKAIILGTIGTDFTGGQANRVSKDCFDALTEMREVPYVDLNGDGVADYSYCDGSSSMAEGENIVITHIGGAVQSGIHSDTGWCYNNSGILYHSSHNTDGIGCCVTSYNCGGHLKCDGHSYCDGHNICVGHPDAQGNLSYCDGCYAYNCDGCKTRYCSGCITYRCYGGISYDPTSCSNEISNFVCNGYNLCLGHKIMKLYLGSYGFDKLLKVKFSDRIEELEAKAELTGAEKQELSQLRMYYEYAVACDANSDPIADEFFSTP